MIIDYTNRHVVFGLGVMLIVGDAGPTVVTRPGLEYTALGRVQYTADEGSIHYTAPAEDA